MFCLVNFLVSYESIKREPKIRPLYECPGDERLQTKAKELTRLTYTGLLGGLEHLKIETRSIDEKIANALGEYVTLCGLTRVYTTSSVKSMTSGRSLILGKKLRTLPYTRATTPNECPTLKDWACKETP